MRSHRGVGLRARAGFLAWLPVLCGAAFGAENLIHNGDFEIAPGVSPPPGWTMWGSEKYKVKANYTRDTGRPHSGEASFRIHHPAGTSGYVISSPERAIRPKTGMTYTASLWVRSDRPGKASFGFWALKNVRPYGSWRVPAFHRIEVGERWRRHTFEIHEGWDFFSTTQRYLGVTLSASADADEERTLWVDDLVVTERPSTRKDRMVDPEALEYPPLEHRLRPGEALDFTVNARRRLRRASRLTTGVSIHRVAGWTWTPYDPRGRYTVPPELERSIRDLRLPMTRAYALGVEAFGLEGAIDRMADFCDRIGVPQETTALEFETQDASSKLPPEVWARGVRHSLEKGYGFRHWEITNEPWNRPAFPTAEAYLDHFLAVSRAVRKVHPEGRIGISICGAVTYWGNNMLLKRAAGQYDFVSAHYYDFAHVGKNSFEDVVLTANFRTLDDVLRNGALIRAYNAGRDVYQYDTEWGLHSTGKSGEEPTRARRNANVYGTMYRAVRMIYYVREDILRGASSWEMFGLEDQPGFGFFSRKAPGKRSMLAWLYHHVNRHVGEWVLEIEGTAPYHEGTLKGKRYAGPLTPAVATLSADGRSLFLMIANGSWTEAAPCRARISGFRAARAEGVVLSHSDPDASPYVEREEDVISRASLELNRRGLTCTVPPHSVLFVTLERR